jgi:hypothetical protein
MHLDRYQFKTVEDLTFFEFISVGPKGRIVKIIQFTPTETEGIYNLALGDMDLSTQTIDYLAVSNNQDSEKVFATVVLALYGFTNLYKDAWIFAEGNTKARTRLYRMGISKYFEKASEDFFILGQISSTWEPFVVGRNYDAFVVKRK